MKSERGLIFTDDQYMTDKPSSFQEEMAIIMEAIDDFEGGRRSNVAVIAEPFYGEGAFLDQLETLTYPRSERREAASLDRSLREGDRSILIVESVHEIYRRKVGGFDKMRQFLDFVASSKKLFIVTCNIYSWEYLEEVLDVEKVFPVQIELPKLNAGQIRERLLEGYSEDELEFVMIEEPAKRASSFSFRLARWDLFLAGRSFGLPYPKVELNSLGDLVPRLGQRVEVATSKDRFFDRLARISGGNPGVIEVLWRRALEYPQVRGEILEEPPSVEIDYDGAYALSLILAMGPLEKKELEEMVGPVDGIVYGLAREGLIFMDGDLCSIRPEALKRAVDHLRRLRLVR